MLDYFEIGDDLNLISFFSFFFFFLFFGGIVTNAPGVSLIRRGSLRSFKRERERERERQREREKERERERETERESDRLRKSANAPLSLSPVQHCWD